MTTRIELLGELEELATPAGRRLARAYPLDRRASIKDVIEALGVPHTEIYALRVDGRAVDFGHVLDPDAPVSIVQAEPARPPLDVTRPGILRPALDNVRFAADVNVGRLAKLLLTLGIDTAWRNNWDDADLAAFAASEQRILLTTDRGLLKRAEVQWGRLVRADEPETQLAEVLTLFGLRGPFTPFSRCLECNRPLTPVDKAQVLHLLRPKTRKYFDTFSRCSSCGRIYWPGSHYERLSERLARLGLPMR